MSIVTNRKAHHDYHILEKYEAGIELTGSEVKSLRDGKANLLGSHIRIEGGEAFLYSCDIAPFEKATLNPHEPKRVRRLLLHKQEILVLRDETQIAGKTVVALDMHWKNGRVKVLLATAKGKHQQDKRRSLKESVQKREVAQAIKRTR